jgi:hypothetical protein
MMNAVPGFLGPTPRSKNIISGVWAPRRCSNLTKLTPLLNSKIIAARSRTSTENPLTKEVLRMKERLPKVLAPLVDQDHWLIWRLEDDRGRPSKVPYQSRHLIGSRSPRTAPRGQIMSPQLLLHPQMMAGQALRCSRAALALSILIIAGTLTPAKSRIGRKKSSMTVMAFTSR